MTGKKKETQRREDDRSQGGTRLGGKKGPSVDLISPIWWCLFIYLLLCNMNYDPIIYQTEVSSREPSSRLRDGKQMEEWFELGLRWPGVGAF